jgi:hypothetical protein
VWKDFQKSYVLEGHTAAVWAVLAVDDDLILTGKKQYLLISTLTNLFYSFC